MLKINLVIIALSIVLFLYGLSTGSEFLAIIGAVSFIVTGSEISLSAKMDEIIERLDGNKND